MTYQLFAERSSLWGHFTTHVIKAQYNTRVIYKGRSHGAAALAQLASDLGSGRQATGRLTAIPIAGCVIDRAVSSKKLWVCFRYSSYYLSLWLN